MSKLKVLVFDIETAPDLASVWGAWKQNIGANMIREEGFIMSWSAKFLDEDYVHYDSCRQYGKKEEKRILKSLAKMIKKADVIVAHNGDNFDMKWLRTQMIDHGLKPLAPVKQVDTLKIAKQMFRFRFNRLDFIAKKLGCSPKLKHAKFPGFELWAECLKGNQEAWDEMEEYNIQDVLTLEEVYLKLRPWAKGNPNLGIENAAEGLITCPKCGGVHLQKRGYAYTGVSKFQRYRCNDCGGWSRGRTNLLAKGVRKSILANVA